MESSKFFLLCCTMIVAVKCSSYSNIDPSAQIDGTARLGNYINVAARVKIGEGVEFGSYSTINQYTSIGRNSKIENYIKIGENTVIENDVNINSYATIGNRNTIAPGSVLSDYVKTADSVIIHENAKLFQYSSIAYDARIGEDVICDDYSSVGQHVTVHPKAYIGKYVNVQKNAIVNQLAVLHEYVVIREGAMVSPYQVVIRKPSSYELYLGSDPVESIPYDLVTIATQGNKDIISPDFNNMLLQLIESDLNKSSTNCKSSNFPYRPEYLRWTISLYLIRFHGLDRHNENRQYSNFEFSNLFSVGVRGFFGNIFRRSYHTEQLKNELHFPNLQKNILTTDVQKKLIQLLAIVQDMERERRIENDSVCSMIAQILSGERDVVCAN